MFNMLRPFIRGGVAVSPFPLYGLAVCYCASGRGVPREGVATKRRWQKGRRDVEGAVAKRQACSSVDITRLCKPMNEGLDSKSGGHHLSRSIHVQLK